MGHVTQVIAKGRTRKFLERSHPLGAIIEELQNTMDAHDDALGSGSSGNAALLTAITALQTADTTDEANIAANTANITTNTTNIATHTTNIATINARVQVRSVPISFETGEVGTVNLFWPSAVTIVGARVCVTKALAGTDDGTIQLKNNAGTNLTSGLLTVPLSSAIGADVAVTPSANNVFTAAQKVQVVTAKTTAGGKGILTLEYTYN